MSVWLWIGLYLVGYVAAVFLPINLVVARSVDRIRDWDGSPVDWTELVEGRLLVRAKNDAREAALNWMVGCIAWPIVLPGFLMLTSVERRADRVNMALRLAELRERERQIRKMERELGIGS